MTPEMRARIAFSRNWKESTLFALQLGDRAVRNAAYLWMPWEMTPEVGVSLNDNIWLMGAHSNNCVRQLAYLEASRVRMGGYPSQGIAELEAK
jgi:hypothetical protein